MKGVDDHRDHHAKHHTIAIDHHHLHHPFLFPLFPFLILIKL